MASLVGCVLHFVQLIVECDAALWIRADELNENICRLDQMH